MHHIWLLELLNSYHYWLLIFNTLYNTISLCSKFFFVLHKHSADTRPDILCCPKPPFRLECSNRFKNFMLISFSLHWGVIYFYPEGPTTTTSNSNILALIELTFYSSIGWWVVESTGEASLELGCFLWQLAKGNE